MESWFARTVSVVKATRLRLTFNFELCRVSFSGAGLRTDACLHVILVTLFVTERRQQFKKTVDSEVGRRRRDETTLQLRKTKKSEQLAKRRAAPSAQINTVGGGSDTSQQDVNRQPPPSLAEVPSLIAIMRNSEAAPNDRLESVRGVRRMLSVEENPPAKQLIELGILPIMIGFLTFDTEPMLQFEAAWALTNIASTEYTARVVHAGAMPGLVRLLECPTPNVREQAAWCVGNIAGDSVELRDLVLKSGALNSL